MNFKSDYQKKCLTAEMAVEKISASEIILLPYGNSQPPALLRALEKRARLGDFKDIVFYYMRSFDHMANTILKYEFADFFKFRPFGMSAFDRVLAKEANLQGDKYKPVDFVTAHFSRIPAMIENHLNIDTFMITVAPMDPQGRFNLGANIAYAKAGIKKAKRVIVEVNKNMPKTHGDTYISIDDIDFIVEHDELMLQSSEVECTKIDRKIGSYICEMIPDGATLQLGIGGVPNAVAELLTSHNDLGVHTELLTSNMIELIKKGVITGKRKTLLPNKHVTSVCFPAQKNYDFIQDNLSIEMRTVDFVNNPFVIAQNENLISVNSVIEMDLLGQANAESIQGRQFNTIGGHSDFMRGAYYAKGGKSILAFHAVTKNNSLSRIVPILSGVVSESRAEIEYVVSEYGVANLAGLSTGQRAFALIELAAPEFRSELLSAAKKLHFIA